MPTYEYVCPAGHQFDRFQKISDAAGADCPECGQAATRKISGGAGLVFKGSGFYITDYGKDGKGPRKAPGEGGEGKPAASGESKSEPKKEAPAAPSTPAPAPKPSGGSGSGGGGGKSAD